jgi:hypothetical protein
MLIRTALAVVSLLGALGLVTWRQSRAFEALGELDETRRLVSVNEAERVDLARTIQVMESRAQVIPRAREELGMHTPDATELVILPGDLTP